MIPAFAAASASALRDTMITLQPSAAKASAVARPIPFEPPVIRAVLPASLRSMDGSDDTGWEQERNRRRALRHPPLEGDGACHPTPNLRRPAPWVRPSPCRGGFAPACAARSALRPVLSRRHRIRI